MNNNLFLLMLGMLLASGGIFLFVMGMENVDSGHNQHRFECRLGFETQDCGFSGCKGYGQVIMEGFAGVLVGFPMAAAGFSLFGYALGGLGS